MKVIRLKAVIARTGLGRSTIYKLQAEGKFPQSISLGARAVGWISSEIDDWVRFKVETRNSLFLQ